MDPKRNMKLLLHVLPINGFILAFIVLFFSSRGAFTFDPSPAAFLSTTVLAAALLSLLLLVAAYKFSEKFLSHPSGSIIFVALPENVVVLGLVAAFLTKNSAVFWPFFFVWLAATWFALKAALRRLEA